MVLSFFFGVYGLRIDRSVRSWLKLTLEKAGIDTKVYTANSSRGASASRAADAGVSVEFILNKAGNWSSESTFTRFLRNQHSSS